jgi:deoxyribodipyrimidine photolyase-related protein
MIGLIFPHQLFEDLAPWQNCNEVLLVEEFLFFKQYHFHQQKIAYHRASMKFYESYLRKNGIAVNYIESTDPRSDVRTLLAALATKEVTFINPVDHWLEKRIIETSAANNIKLHKLPNPGFLNSEAELANYLRGKNRLFQTDFYKKERLKRGILLDEAKNPQGGQWTFDAENRLKYPKNKIAPAVEKPTPTPFYTEAVHYTRQHFGSNYGLLADAPIYPHDFDRSKMWLQNFLQTRFAEFGPYEDAIVANETILHHSVLTPMLNTGLLTPQFVVEETLRFAEENSIPINSVEGFIRQIIGWREFIRMVYISKGSAERTRNYWGFTRKIPPQFWDGTTGILPIDQTIKKVLKTGYCHHIERLMVVGNFMLLCEFDPDEVYRWFMELFIDAYDWVMVPNVYGMSQFADGGLMATKPYISGSNYLLKMSNYPKGDWQPIWDALFWRFMHQHRSFFLQNPRLGMLVKTFDKWDTAKQTAILARAETYLAGLDLD